MKLHVLVYIKTFQILPITERDVKICDSSYLSRFFRVDVLSNNLTMRHTCLTIHDTHLFDNDTHLSDNDTCTYVFNNDIRLFDNDTHLI